MAKQGDRVGAVLSTDAEKKIVYTFGGGIYEGDEVPPEGSGMMGMLNKAGIPNPKLVMDSGEVVWGCLCWWGSEAGYIKQVEKWTEAGYTLEEIKMSDV